MILTASTSNSSWDDNGGSGTVLARGCPKGSIWQAGGAHRCLESIIRSKWDRPEHARPVVNSADVEFDPSRWRALLVLLTGSFLLFPDFSSSTSLWRQFASTFMQTLLTCSLSWRLTARRLECRSLPRLARRTAQSIAPGKTAARFSRRSCSPLMIS
jgi:hypothetical protein